MKGELTAVIGWLFLLIFTILAVISILDLIKLIEIRGESQRKWLFRSVLGAAVLAVGGLGNTYYKNQAQQIKNPVEAIVAVPNPAVIPRVRTH